jgi:hypothetical protein
VQFLERLIGEEEAISTGGQETTPLDWDDSVQPGQHWTPQRTSSARVDFGQDPALTGKDVAAFCICHQLNLAAEKAASEDQLFRLLSEQVGLFLGAVRRSPKENQLILDRCGLTVLHPPATRWLGLSLSLQRLLRIREGVDASLASVNLKRAERGHPDLRWNWDSVETAVELLRPLFQAIATLEGSNYITALMPLYVVGLLRDYYTQVGAADGYVFKTFCSTICRQLEKRFRDYFPHPRTLHVADKRWLVAAFLDPWLATHWAKLSYMEGGKAALERFFLDSPLAPSKDDDLDTSGSVHSQASNPTSPQTTPSSILPCFLTGKTTADSPPADSVASGYNAYYGQLQRYISFLANGGATQTPAELQDQHHVRVRVSTFWASTRKFNLLKNVAFSALIQPASSAQTERLERASSQ